MGELQPSLELPAAHLRLDDCQHCAAVTLLSGHDRASAIEALERGALGCWLCSEDQEGDGHCACVRLYAGDEVIWDGRCR